MNDSVISTLHVIPLISCKEKPEDKIQNAITTCSKIYLNLRSDYSSIDDEIHKNRIHWDAIINKKSKYDSLLKEKEKCSMSIMYTDGEIQFTNKIIDTNKEQINEMEKLIQEACVKLTKLEYENKRIRQNTVDKHTAFKKAIKYYKADLDVYIHVERTDDIFFTTICYFTQKLDDTYSLLISKNDKENKWTLINVSPHLEMSQFTALRNRFNNSNNLSALLYTIKKIFIMYKNSRI